MKIDQISIRNFRCFGADPVTVSLQDCLTTFVGNNGSGKTAIFAALSKLFGVTQAQRIIQKRDFHIAKGGTELASGATITIDCILSFPELESHEDDDAGEDENTTDPNDNNEEAGEEDASNDGVDDSAVPDFFHHMAASDEDAPLKVRVRLQAVWTEDGTPEGSIEEDVRWIRTLDDDFVWNECSKVRPAERSLIQLIYVPASRNAADQVTTLLKGRLWRAALWSIDLGQKAAENAEKIQRQFDSEEPAKFITERLQKRWKEVHFGSTDTTPKLRLVEAELDELVKRAEFIFHPDEVNRTRRLDELSDGQRSLFHIALTAATLEIERDALALKPDESVFDQEKLRRVHLTILAIEEPENSLSPFFLARIMKQAREIGRMDGAQVVISSHSASILGRTEAEEVRYCRLIDDTRCSTVRQLILPPLSSDAGKYVRLAVKAYPELYFARFAVLAEGDSESIVLPRVAEALDVPLDQSFVPVVPLGGRFVTHFWKLLNDLNIPHATLLDLDLGRKHGGAKAIKYAVEQLQHIGNDLSNNELVINGEVNVNEIDNIDEAELLRDGQNHPWLKALRRENVYFSSPIDLDFSMLMQFPSEYMKPRLGGTGPRRTASAIEEKKKVSLKTDGKPVLYDESYNDEFTWYPYLFLNDSKPETHLRALSEMDDLAVALKAPLELRFLINKIQKQLEI